MDWKHVARLSPKQAVVTGAGAEEASETAPPTSIEDRRKDPLRRQPLLIFVHDNPALCAGDCDGACQRYYDVEADVFGKEKLAVATRAFRAIWMTPAEAAAEPLLADLASDALPRLILLDVARTEAVVLDGSRLSSSRVYAALKKAAKGFYRASLDRTVKGHVKLLTEYDKLAQEEYRLREQESSTQDERRAQKLRDQLDELEDARRDLDRTLEDLWELELREL